MKVHILKENLVKAVQAALKFTANKAQVPVLANVLLEATNEGIFILATNLEMGLKLRVAGKVEEAGKVMVPAKVLAELVQHLPMGGVLLHVTEKGLLVEGGRVKARLQQGDVGDFPPFPNRGQAIGKLDIEAMRQALFKVGYAVSNDEARPVLMGVLWRIGENALVATDGFRLSLVEKLHAWEMVKKQSDMLVPGKALIQLLETSQDFGGRSCEISFDEQTQQLVFGGQELTVAVRILDGNYPQYETILPQVSAVEVAVDRQDFLEAVRAAAIFARDSANIVRLTIDSQGLQVSANAAQVGENVVEVDAEMIKTGTIMIAFNSRYLVDFLTHSEAERVGMGFNDALKPGLFYEVGQTGYRHVIMPVRVREAA